MRFLYFTAMFTLGLWMGWTGQSQTIDLTWHQGDTDPVRIEPTFVPKLSTKATLTGTTSGPVEFTTAGTANTITVVGAGGGSSNSLFISK